MYLIVFLVKVSSTLIARNSSSSSLSLSAVGYKHRRGLAVTTFCCAKLYVVRIPEDLHSSIRHCCLYTYIENALYAVAEVSWKEINSFSSKFTLLLYNTSGL